MNANRIDPKNVDLDFLKEEFSRFRTEIAGMKDRLGSSATDVLDQMSTYLNGSAMSSRLATLESEFETIAGRLKGSGKEAVNRLESGVVERPIASLAIAFGVGLLAAQFIRRS